MTPQIATAIAVGLINAVLGWAVYRMNRSLDARELRADRLESRVSAIELSIAGELPNKEDMAQLLTRMERLEATLGEVRDMSRDMAIRFDEREKARHG